MWHLCTVTVTIPGCSADRGSEGVGLWVLPASLQGSCNYLNDEMERNRGETECSCVWPEPLACSRRSFLEDHPMTGDSRSCDQTWR